MGKEPTSGIEQKPLFRGFRPIVTALILISLSCSVAALYLPFITLRRGVISEEYSLPHSVSMLWDEGLFALAVLVVAFSIIFPFAKIAVLAWVAITRSLSPRMIHWLHRVERLGKWSMLDAFLVSIILSLASNQFLIGAKPELGLSLFIVAILLSMTCGELLVRALSKEHILHATSGKPQAGLLLILSGLALIASLSFPFLRIEDWLLKNREYSIVTLVPALWNQGAWLASLITAFFLVAAPVLVLFANLSAWLKRRTRKASPIPDQIVTIARQWSMLDVFGLSLTVFAIESDHLMRAEIRWGAFFLGATLLLQMLFSQALNRQLR